MPRRSILSAQEKQTLLALPDTQDDFIRHYSLTKPTSQSLDKNEAMLIDWDLRLGYAICDTPVLF